MAAESSVPSSALTGEHADQFVALTRRFCEGLSARCESLLAAADDAQRHAVLHQLAGAAGAYGFDALTEQARHTMAALGTAQQAQAVAELVAAMRDLAAKNATI